ncbi:MAG: hypothetical protein ACNA8K_16355 [Cyclonatronaceae bacterium]
MPDKRPQKNYAQLNEEDLLPSDYVQLEADLASDPVAKGVMSHDSSKKSILIYCKSHKLLQEIASELRNNLETEVEILTTTDKGVAKKLLKSGDIDLLLHGPAIDQKNSSSGDLTAVTNFATGSALILTHSRNPEMEAWMKNKNHSRLLTQAVIRLNEQAAV